MRIAAALIAALLPLSLFAAEPKFAAAVDAEKYPSVAAPAEAALFRWDFSAKRDNRFTFEQTAAQTSSFEPGESPMSAKGDLVVRTNGDGTARIVMEGVKVSMTMPSNEGAPAAPRTMEQAMPTSVAGTMTEDGRVASQQSPMQLLFPLPPSSLAVGKTADVPFQLPFNANGSALRLKGISHITHAGYVMLGKRLCARFEERAEVLKLDVPEEVPGKYDVSMTATGVAFFDVHERRFVRAVVASHMAIKAEIAMPKLEGEAAGSKGSQPEKMSMTSDDRITVSISE